MRVTSLKFGFGASLLLHVLVAEGIATGLIKLGSVTLPESREEQSNLTIFFESEDVITTEEPAILATSEIASSQEPEPSHTAPEPEPEIQNTPGEPPPVQGNLPIPEIPQLGPNPETIPQPQKRGPASATEVRESRTPGNSSGTLSAGPESRPVRNNVVTGARARPNYRNNPDPAYPISARRRKQEGSVLLRVVVTAQGRVERIEIKASSGVTALDEAAINAVRSWEFEPARLDSEAIASEVEVPIQFKLQR